MIENDMMIAGVCVGDVEDPFVRQREV